jgi:hypothetical protein
LRVKSRREDPRRSSRAQQNPRYPAAPPPSCCSSSRDSIGRAPSTRPDEIWVPIPKPNRGRVESGSVSVKSTRMSSPAPTSIRQRSSANTLVENQGPPTTLPPDRRDRPGLLASGTSERYDRGPEWEEIQSDSSSYADSEYRLHPGGYVVRLLDLTCIVETDQLAALLPALIIFQPARDDKASYPSSDVHVPRLIATIAPPRTRRV